MLLISIFLLKLNHRLLACYKSRNLIGHLWLGSQSPITNTQAVPAKDFPNLITLKNNNNNNKPDAILHLSKHFYPHDQGGLHGNELKMLWTVGPFESSQIMRADDKHPPFVQLPYLLMSSISAFPFIPSRMEAEEEPLRRRPFTTTATQSRSFC